MACPYCDNIDVIAEKQRRQEDMYPNVYFLDVVLKCEGCGFGWHCVGTKQLNKSDNEV